MSKIRAYVAHSIRGKFGNDATEEQMVANNQKAIVFGKQLAKEFPNIDFYVPGYHDEFVLIAYKKGYLTEEQILDTDCVIVSRCNFLVVFAPDDYISKGMQIEIDYCVYNNIPVIAAVDGDDKEYFTLICYGVNCHLTSMMR